MSSFEAETRAEMARQNIGASRLAELSGISRQQINLKVQREKRRLNGDEMNAIGTALGVPAWELMRRAAETQEGKAAA